MQTTLHDSSTADLRMDVDRIKTSLAELNEQIGQLENDIANIYETPVFMSAEEFKDELAPPEEFFRDAGNCVRETLNKRCIVLRLPEEKETLGSPLPS